MIKKPSIAILTWGLKGGSLANYTLALARGFLDAGITQIYVAYIARDPGEGVEIPAGVELIPLNAKRARSAPFHIAKMIRQVRPDILISVSAFVNMPATIGWLFSGVHSTQLIVSQHSTMSYKARVELKHDLQFRLQPAMARLLYPRATALHANSRRVLDDLLQNIKVKVPHERAFFTNNPVDATRIRKSCQATPQHPWLQDQDFPTILSVGRLAKQKNFPLLINAVADLQQSQPVRLIILGEGPERQALEEQIQRLGLEDRVSLPGFCSNPWAEMAHADVFALSSEEEPFGLVLVEAMVCGLPIVSTCALGEGPQAVLENGKYGLLVPEATAACLSKNLSDLLSNPKLRDQMIELGTQRYHQFEPKRIAEQWLLFIDKNLSAQ